MDGMTTDTDRMTAMEVNSYARNENDLKAKIAGKIRAVKEACCENGVTGSFPLEIRDSYFGITLSLMIKVE
jgi:hypothetical protein